MTRARALHIIHALERQAHARELQILGELEAGLLRLHEKREAAGGVLRGALVEAADGGPLSLLGSITEKSRERLRGIDARIVAESAEAQAQHARTQTHAMAAKRYETIIERRSRAARDQDDHRTQAALDDLATSRWSRRAGP